VASHRELRLGTRGSQLALWQANTVAERLAAAGGPRCRIVTIKTSGDRLQDAPLSQAGGKRLFVKEIEDALANESIDLAVHSSKDLPVELYRGLTVGAVLPREDPRDALVLPRGATTGSGFQVPGSGFQVPGSGFESVEQVAEVLGHSPTIGTSSVRRTAQLSALWPGALFLPVRGNLDTRLRKLDEGEYSALVLAAAGLKRLGWESRISLSLPLSACVPAPGQGIVAIEIRGDDEPVQRAVAAISDSTAFAALDAERAVVVALGGGCQTPIGALASPVDRETIELVGVVVAPDGSRIIRAAGRAAIEDSRDLGGRIARGLLDQGAAEILAACR
jgi:hydroxymethylbilane synthase